MDDLITGLGCLLLIAIVVVVGLFQYILANPWVWILVVTFIALGIVFSRSQKAEKNREMIASLEEAAQIMDDIVAGKEVNFEGGFALEKNEKLLYVIPNVLLTEYQSTGSSYSGSSAGVSFPLAGRIRGNVSGQRGSITKNPEQLMAVDSGRAIFTDQRIVFTGAKFVRDWDFTKVVDLSPGTNGFNVRIAVSNRERTSGLQSPSINTFGPGYVAGYAFTLHDQGSAKAKTWANDVSKRARELANGMKVQPKAKPAEKR